MTVNQGARPMCRSLRDPLFREESSKGENVDTFRTTERAKCTDTTESHSHTRRCRQRPTEETCAQKSRGKFFTVFTVTSML